MLLTERAEPLGCSACVVDDSRQTSAHCLLCSENLVGQRQCGQEGSGKGITNEWVIRFHKLYKLHTMPFSLRGDRQ